MFDITWFWVLCSFWLSSPFSESVVHLDPSSSEAIFLVLIFVTSVVPTVTVKGPPSSYNYMQAKNQATCNFPTSLKYSVLALSHVGKLWVKCAQNAFSTLGKACSFDRLGYCGQRATVDELLPSACTVHFVCKSSCPVCWSQLPNQVMTFWLPNPSATTMPQPVPEVTEGLSFSQRCVVCSSMWHCKIGLPTLHLILSTEPGAQCERCSFTGSSASTIGPKSLGGPDSGSLRP